MFEKIYDLVGSWVLTATFAIESQEVDFIGDDVDPIAIANWLNASGIPHLREAKPDSGLVLAIAKDGTFTETASDVAEFLWFNVEGILTQTAEPFRGRLVESANSIYMSSDALYKVRIKSKYAPAIVRLDDGEVVICEFIQLYEDKLVRTANTVFDGIYLYRGVYIYERSPTSS